MQYVNMYIPDILCKGSTDLVPYNDKQITLVNIFILLHRKMCNAYN